MRSIQSSAFAYDLDYMHARYYSVFLGRFMSVDPAARRKALRTPQLFNRYSYALSNPTNYVDPDGLRPLRANELKFFNAFFSGADFSSVDVRGGLLGRAVTTVASADGVTLGETVFLAPSLAERFDTGNPGVVALVGHELTHVLQYQHLGGRRFLEGYLQNYMFNRSSGQPHGGAYRDIILEQAAEMVEDVMLEFLRKNSDIAAKFGSGQPFTGAELSQISPALQQAINEGEFLEEGFQLIQGFLVRVEYPKE